MSTAVFSKREEEILTACVEIIKKLVNPGKIILFGSRAKNSVSTHSDFDIAVDTAEPEHVVMEKLKNEIECISGLYKVDIVFMKEVDRGFRDIIINTGVVIYGS